MEAWIVSLLTDTLKAIITSLVHNWVPLTFAILTAAVMSAYIDAEKMKKALMKKPKVSMIAAVAVGAFTPLCACGTMGIIIGMLTTTLPWGPIMAFLTSSPLMSPDGFIMIAGIISMKFAIALAVSSVVIGLASGLITHAIEKKTRWLENQTRFAGKSASLCGSGCATDDEIKPEVSRCDCGSITQGTPRTVSCECSDGCSDGYSDTAQDEQANCTGTTRFTVPVYACCAGPNSVEIAVPNRLICFVKNIKYRAIYNNIINVGLKQILLYFAIFVGIGYLVNYFVPSSVITGLFGAHNVYSVPLAALIGLPLYISGDAAVPFINSLMSSGASGGSMLAFLITGPGTSAWVIVGIAVFMKRRVIALYVGYLLVFGIALGYLYDMLNVFME